MAAAAVVVVAVTAPAAPARAQDDGATAAPAPAPPAAAQACASPRRTAAFVAAGISAAGAVAATVFGVLAVKNHDDNASHPTADNAQDGMNDAAYSDGGIVLAVAAGITSLVLFLTDEASQDGPGSGPGAAAPPPPRA